MADQSVEVRFGFIRIITCNESDVQARIESMRKRFERELQLATKDNDLKLRASKGFTDPPPPRMSPEEVKRIQDLPRLPRLPR